MHTHNTRYRIIKQAVVADNINDRTSKGKPKKNLNGSAIKRGSSTIKRGGGVNGLAVEKKNPFFVAFFKEPVTKEPVYWNGFTLSDTGTRYSRCGQKSYSIIFSLVPVRKIISVQEIYSDSLFINLFIHRLRDRLGNKRRYRSAQVNTNNITVCIYSDLFLPTFLCTFFDF